jgi:hypothetical protein
LEFEPPVALVNVPSTTTTADNPQTDSVTESTATHIKPVDDAAKAEKQTAFRRQFADLLNPNASTDRV